ncbi:MAG: general secretion pathway protein GspD [Betaproteobacteria bacterium]|nr:general secretion pathway protein GspD [Betaproteobacteria bacterium]MDH3438225.1 general secretion pathway protein GspD [Betaproteobacteria bacterium]
MKPQSQLFRFLLTALAACMLLVACAADPVEEARKQFAEGGGEEALAALDRAVKADPSNHALRGEYFRERDLLVVRWLGQAEALRRSGQYAFAEEFYQRALKYDAANPRARAGIAQIEADKRHRTIVAAVGKLVEAGKYSEAQDALRPVLVENPQHREAQRLQRRIDEKLIKPAIAAVRLKTTTTEPISLELRDVTLRGAFDVISRVSGVNFVFDKDVRADQKTTILVRGAKVEEAIRLVLVTNQLEQKILSENTVLVFPNTLQKLREYQELVVKSFYLANADVRQTANMIRALVRTRNIFIDEKLNLLVIKDTPQAVRLAERLVAAQDLAEPEVVLEVEVLEVKKTRLLELGVRWPEQVFIQDPATVGAGATLSRVSAPLSAFILSPALIVELHQQDGTAVLLANPRVRVKNKEKANIHIGDRVPVITTTAAATGGFVSENVSYLDVGLKLEVEPQIFLDDDIGIKVALEVSNIVQEIRSDNGSVVYQIGTRTANTTLRLHDGETQVLAGLIGDEDRRSADRIPGLGDLPIVGRLFSASSDTTTKTEIVLLITPRLVRTLARPDVRSAEFAAGTEAATGAPPVRGVPRSPGPPGPAPAPPTPPATPRQPTPVPSTVPFGGVQPGAPRP